LRKAYDVEAAAKANAEKSQKSALGKAKKAEKALAEAKKEHNESKPWRSVFTPCLVPLKVSSSTCLSIFNFCCTCVPVVTCLFFSFLFVQNLPGYLRRLCKQTMIL
jgi:hypothetical protein